MDIDQLTKASVPFLRMLTRPFKPQFCWPLFLAEIKLPALLFRKDYRHHVVTLSYLSIMIWKTWSDYSKNKRLKIKRYDSFEENYAVLLYFVTS